MKPTQKKVCFNLEVKKLDTITDGHIHKGAEGVAGDVKVPLFVGPGSSTGRAPTTAASRT